MGDPPGLAREIKIDPHPDTPASPQARDPSGTCLRETSPPSWLGAGTGTGRVQQLWADPREFLAGRFPLVLACPLPMLALAAGRLDLFWLAPGSTPSCQRLAPSSPPFLGSAPPPLTHAAYFPSLCTLPWDRESYRLKTLSHCGKQGTTPKTLLLLFNISGQKSA
ncbi:uncharacterized protein LOC144579565 [Callithrix jacchus]